MFSLQHLVSTCTPYKSGHQDFDMFVSILAVFKTLQKIIFGYLVFVALRGLSLVAVGRSTVHCCMEPLLIAGGFSCCTAQALGILSSCKSQALEHGLSRCGACVSACCVCMLHGRWNLPGS